MNIAFTLEGKTLVPILGKPILYCGEVLSDCFCFHLPTLSTDNVTLIWKTPSGFYGQTKLSYDGDAFLWRPEEDFCLKSGQASIQLEISDGSGSLWKSSIYPISILEDIHDRDGGEEIPPVMESRYYTKAECDTLLEQFPVKTEVSSKEEMEEIRGELETQKEKFSHSEILYGQKANALAEKMDSLENMVDPLVRRLDVLESDLQNCGNTYPFFAPNGEARAQVTDFPSLDAIVESGLYFSKGGHPGTPVSRMGFLVVFADPAMVTQMYIALTGICYIRVYLDQVWDAWMTFTVR